VASDEADTDLLKRWQAGDEDAGNALVERHFRTVYRFFRRKSDHGAEDLTQRTFLACLESRARLDDVRSFRAFLLGIARNVYLVDQRTRGRLDKRMDRLAHEPEPSRVSPSKAAAANQEQRLLLKALRMLSIDHQLVIELHYWEHLSTAEISEVVEVPQGTVKWRLSKAREALREALESLADDPVVKESTMTNLEKWAASIGKLVGEGEQPDESE
jgi:RNA polymerase sigma-70 factor (ECF subfamily)